MKKTDKIPRRGITLTEVMLVLGVAAILLGLAMTIYSLVSTKNSSNNVIEELFVIRDAAMNLSTGKTDWNSVTAASLAESGLIPRRYISPDKSNLIDPYGNIIDIIQYSDSAVNKTSSTSLGIYFNNIPKTACVSLALLDIHGLGNAVNVNWDWAGGVTDYGLTAQNAAQDCKDGFTNWVGINLTK